MLQLLSTALEWKQGHFYTHTHTRTVYKETRWTLYTSSPAYGTHVTLATWAPEGDSVSP